MCLVVGEILHRDNFIDDLDEEEAYNEGGGAPPDEMQMRPGNQNNLLGAQMNSVYYKQRYKCHSCDAPDCANPVMCSDAITVSLTTVQQNIVPSAVMVCV